MRTKPKADKTLTIRISSAQLEKLEEYCVRHSKTKTEVLLGFIEELKVDKK